MKPVAEKVELCSIFKCSEKYAVVNEPKNIKRIKLLKN